MKNQEKLADIHLSFVNGQRKQAVTQIVEYGNYDFWEDYKNYLESLYHSEQSWYKYFTDATVSYFRIVNR